MVEVARIELASKVVSNRGHYVCSHITASDGVSCFVPQAKPGDFLARTSGQTSLSLVYGRTPTSLPIFCYRYRPLKCCYNLKTMQPLQIRCFQLNVIGFLLGLPINLDTLPILQQPCRNQCTPKSEVLSIHGLGKRVIHRCINSPQLVCKNK